MRKTPFSEQYKHPNWQKKRLEKFESVGFECESCGDSENTLHVHHKKYVAGRKIWEYELGELKVLCEFCHGSIHEILADLDPILRECSYWELHLIQAFAKGTALANATITEARIPEYTPCGEALDSFMSGLEHSGTLRVETFPLIREMQGQVLTFEKLSALDSQVGSFVDP